MGACVASICFVWVKLQKAPGCEVMNGRGGAAREWKEDKKSMRPPSLLHIHGEKKVSESAWVKAWVPYATNSYTPYVSPNFRIDDVVTSLREEAAMETNPAITID